MTQTFRPKICDKKIKVAESKILKILNKIDGLKLNNHYVSRLNVPKKGYKSVYSIARTKLHVLRSICIFLIFLIGTRWIYKDFLTSRNCFLNVPFDSKALFRPPEDCSMCTRVDAVVRVSNTTPYQFEKQYAYSANPVIITDATDGWKAMKEFSFEFFSNFYRFEKMGKKINDCFYFAYKSGINSLQEVFNMNEVRANLSGEPWYVGWSTCHDEETRKLRVYYNRPYFLPETAESDMVDWIFMGGPGQGAHMHVDSVKHMSWQAQIRGHKQWQLAPPPECLYRCSWITFTVAPGEILVVDTNRWYHKTNVLPGDISITIGAEYD